jgi:hypothetical protein
LKAEEATLLHAVLSETIPKSVIVHKAGDPAKHYQVWDKCSEIPFVPGKTYAKRYAASPLTEEAVYPIDCKENNLASIEGRVVKPNLTAEAKIARSKYLPKYERYALEFVKFLVPDNIAGTGTPFGHSDVIEKQSKAAQRTRSAQQSMNVDQDFQVKAFQKKEAYNTPAEPRNISSVPTSHTLGLSRYTYAFKEDVLKHHKWFAPCKTPREIANRMQVLADNHEELVCTDFSRFDGHITRWVLDHVQNPVYLRWVAEDDYAELLGYLRAEMNAKATIGRNETRVKYDPGCSRLSGSPLTTDGNTIIHAYFAYCLGRRSGMSPADSFKQLGLMGGDDGVHASYGSDKFFTGVANDIGMNLKVEKRARRGDYVTFYSRVFPDPWTTGASFQSVKRTLLKLHTTTGNAEDPELDGCRKTESYLITDAATPIIGQWCRAYLRNTKQCVHTEEAFEGDVPWWVQTAEFRENPWPQLTDPDAVLSIMADDLGCTATDITRYCQQLDDYTGSVMEMPSLSVEPIPSKIDAVVDLQVVEAPLVQDTEQVDEDKVVRQNGKTTQGPVDLETARRPEKSSRSTSSARGERGEGRAPIAGHRSGGTSAKHRPQSPVGSDRRSRKRNSQGRKCPPSPRTPESRGSTIPKYKSELPDKRGPSNGPRAPRGSRT